MPYLFVGIIIASFASGYGFAYKVSQAEIRKMSDSISAMNREAEWTLAALTKEADKAHTEALKLNKELEDANVSAINAINSQHDSFKSVRMYDNSRKSSSCPKQKIVIPLQLLEPMKIEPNFQTNLANFSSLKPTEQTK
jgi:hypothetical protein